MKIINVCSGAGCPLATKCAKSEFNEESTPDGCWRRHYVPQRIGQHCEDFKPIHPQAWGVGADGAS